MSQPPGRTVLLADDNPVNRHAMSLVLAKLGHQVDTAADGSEALEALRKTPYDVVVLDLHMPRIDGAEAIRRIREQWSADERPRLILLTASASRAARETCMKAGADAFLIKPAEIGRLDRTIRGLPEVVTVVEPLDTSVLADVAAEMGDDVALIPELIEVFLEDADRRIDGLRDALRGDDPVAFGSTAHALKGGAGAVGATVLAQRCRDCEYLSPRDLADRGEDLLADIEAELERAREALLALGAHT